PPLSRETRRTRPAGHRAQADVGRRLVAIEARRRTGTDPARSAPPSQAREKTRPRRRIMSTTTSLPAALPHQIDRTVTIHAVPETVFRFFTDSARWASWWGAGSTIDAKPGGRVYIKHPGGIESAGEVLEIRPPRKLVFSYGFVSGKPIPAGASRVTIELEPDRAGTRLHLKHELADESTRDEHEQGWRFQLSLFANAVSNEVAAGAATLVDSWFDAWAEANASARERLLGDIATREIRFQDAYSNLDG